LRARGGIPQNPRGGDAREIQLISL